jgi:hypothetical protein
MIANPIVQIKKVSCRQAAGRMRIGRINHLCELNESLARCMGAQRRTTGQERTHRLPAPRAVSPTFRCNAEDRHDAGSADHEGVSRLRHARPTTRAATRRSSISRPSMNSTSGYGPCNRISNCIGASTSTASRYADPRLAVLTPRSLHLAL